MIDQRTNVLAACLSHTLPCQHGLKRYLKSLSHTTMKHSRLPPSASFRGNIMVKSLYRSGCLIHEPFPHLSTLTPTNYFHSKLMITSHYLTERLTHDLILYNYPPPTPSNTHPTSPLTNSPSELLL